MHLLYTFLLCATATLASLDFSVVAPEATSVQVSIGGTNYAMMAKWPGIGYFKVTVAGVSGTPAYNYVVDGTAESFTRTFPSGRNKTYNDFYGRQNTLFQTTPLGWPFTDRQQWTRNRGPSGIFNEDYIATIIFSGNDVAQFISTVSFKQDFDNFTAAMITRDDAKLWNDASLHFEDTSQLKPNMVLKLTENYKHRSDYKLRPSVADPVFMRDHLYNNILEAIGCPHQEAGFTRVYVNGVGLGLYNLMEKTGSNDFIKNQFYGTVKNPDVLGVPLDTTTGADFEQGSRISAFIPSGKNGTNAGVQLLINALTALDTSSIQAIQNFDRDWWDIELFFRAMAMEYLTGDYDSYWFSTTNYVIYDDPTEGSPGTLRYYFIDQDFDQTFGVNLSPTYNPYGANYTSMPYTTYVNKTWNVVTGDAPHRYMLDKLLYNPTYRAHFEDILKTIVSGLFNPPALNRRIDSLNALLRPEIAWDYGLGINNRAHQGNATYRIVWSISDYDNGFTTKLRGNWGLKTFIQERANAVAAEFGISFINPPLDPPVQTTTTTGDNDDGEDDDDGTTTGTTGQADSTGQGATATGQGATATGQGATATGQGATATGQATGSVSGSLTSGMASGQMTTNVIINQEASAGKLLVSAFVVLIMILAI